MAVKLYVINIKAGRWTYAKVATPYKEAVKAALIEEGREDLVIE